MCLQKRWLDGDAIINAINMLALMPKCPAVARGEYDSKNILQALQKGLGAKSLVGDSSPSDFDSDSSKQYFFSRSKTRDGTRYFLYVDMSESKIVPAPHVLNKEWLDTVSRQTTQFVHRKNILPVELIELTNYWYSSNAEELFHPIEDEETPMEAAKNQLKLLTVAANDDTKMRELIDGLGVDDELPVHNAHCRSLK